MKKTTRILGIVLLEIILAVGLFSLLMWLFINLVYTNHLKTQDYVYGIIIFFGAIVLSYCIPLILLVKLNKKYNEINLNFNTAKSYLAFGIFLSLLIFIVTSGLINTKNENAMYFLFTTLFAIPIIAYNIGLYQQEKKEPNE